MYILIDNNDNNNDNSSNTNDNGNPELFPIRTTRSAAILLAAGSRMLLSMCFHDILHVRHLSGWLETS